MKLMASKSIVLCACAWLSACSCFGESFDPKTASMDDLIYYAQQTGTTPEKRELKELVRQELFARGTNSLKAVMHCVYMENIPIRVLAGEIVDHTGATQAPPVLVEFLTDEHPKTRKQAAYLLGLNQNPEWADRLLPLLQDDEACGTVVRTLGKWRIQSAVPQIIPFLKDEKETRRIAAANALRDIGDPVAVPQLIPLLDDPFFTVREVAARALSTMGGPAESALLKALPTAGEQAKRHIIRTLGVMKSKKAIRPLQKLLKDEDPLIRADTAEALGLIAK